MLFDLLNFLRKVSFIDKVLISQSASLIFLIRLHPWTTLMLIPGERRPRVNEFFVQIKI
jgi:hypothetical protein